MIAKIIKLQPDSVGAEYPPIDPNKLLCSAIDQYREIVIVGIDKEGEVCIQMSHGTEEHALFLLEKAKVKLLDAW